MKKLILTLLILFITTPALAESAYERVMRTGTIRCGWGTAHPFIQKNLETGQMEGLSVELIDAVADVLDLELDWGEETGWGNLPTSLKTGRVDVACSSLWIDPVRGKQIAYTQPIMYTPVYPYAREDNEKFFVKDPVLNDPSVTIMTQDGDITAMLTQRYYGKAKQITLPNMSMYTDLFLSVTTGKADLTFSNPVVMQEFNKNQEINLKKIDLGKPLVLYANAYAVSIHEHELKEMLDATVAYLLYTGEIQALTDRFEETYPDSLMSVKLPYEATN